MSASSEIEEAMEGQDSVGTEPVTEQPMREQSPLRTLSYVFGLGQLEAGTGQYVLAPVATSSAGKMAQGVDCQNDGKMATSVRSRTAGCRMRRRSWTGFPPKESNKWRSSSSRTSRPRCRSGGDKSWHRIKSFSPPEKCSRRGMMSSHRQ